MNAPAAKRSSTPFSVLLVDDVTHGMVARKTVLTELGYAVRTATSQAEALGALSEAGARFDVVVTDYKIPGIDGVELIRQARAISPAARFVLLSGLVDVLGMTNESSGADAVLAKSSGEMGHLVRLLKNLLSRKPARKPAISQKKPLTFMVKSS